MNDNPGFVRSPRRSPGEIELIEPRKVEVAPHDIDAYGYLEGVLQRRWPYEPELARCARELLPYQRPKLSVQVQVGASFAEKLEEAIERRSKRMEQVNPKLIEATPVEPSAFRRRI
jgi:hypothetical protein